MTLVEYVNAMGDANREFELSIETAGEVYRKRMHGITSEFIGDPEEISITGERKDTERGRNG